jgi:pilus assembly protein Flp/PilA
MRVPEHLHRLTHQARDRGASAVEYGLMVAAIAAVIVGTVFALGGLVKSTFDKTCSSISTAAPVDSDPGCGAPDTGTNGSTDTGTDPAGG